MINSRFQLFNTSSSFLWIILLLMLWPTISILSSQQIILLEWVIMSTASTPIMLTLIADPIGMLFSCTVLFISANVLMFSTVYMSDDKFINRFTVLVLLFILSMNFLIFMPHFMILLLGWDGLGIVSFILVIYYQNPKSLAAGMITALTNRVGDVMLLLSIAWTINQGHWLITNMWVSSESYLQIFCITVAAMTKSAQMPFSSWLPAAMAAPTPVSALVHSSTLVTAGVFLLIRFYPFLHSSQYFNITILFIAVCTMTMAGLSAISECDMKKIIALSTLSQLGMMMTSIGFNMPQLAFFHMITHALFKALLFICAGSFINSHLHSQDLRWMGNLTMQMPIATSCITVANMALCGFPFMAGFYSKDLIMESALNMSNSMPMIFMTMFSIGLTTFYSMRFSVATMWSSQSSASMINITEKMMIIIPMILLSVLSISAGSMMSWMSPMSSSVFMLPTYMKIMPIFMVTTGVLMGWLLSTSNILQSNTSFINSKTKHASLTMWYLSPLSSQFMLKFPMWTAHHNMKSMDQGWMENYSGLGSNAVLLHTGNMLSISLPKSPTSYLITAALSTAMIPILFMIFSS